MHNLVFEKQWAANNQEPPEKVTQEEQEDFPLFGEWEEEPPFGIPSGNFDSLSSPEQRKMEDWGNLFREADAHHSSRSLAHCTQH